LQRSQRNFENFDLHFFQWKWAELHSIKCTILQLLPHCSCGIFFGILGGTFLENVFGGKIFEMGCRQILQLDEAADLTFTTKTHLDQKN